MQFLECYYFGLTTATTPLIFNTRNVAVNRQGLDLMGQQTTNLAFHIFFIMFSPKQNFEILSANRCIC